MSGITVSAQERDSLRSKIEAGSIPVPECGCWLWLGSTGSTGYGSLSFHGSQMAHRAAYAAFVGSVPAGLFVCHKCDTPSCVNPAHLFLGTNLDNVRDMLAKKRHPSQAITHCLRGHCFDAANTSHDRRGRRICKACDRIRQASYWRRADRRNPRRSAP